VRVLRRWLWCGLAAAIWCGAARAAAPVLESLYPAGGQRGATLTVTAIGKFEPWPVKGWADSADIKIEPGPPSGGLTIKIGENVPTGPHLLRLFNSEGASSLRLFMVGQSPELMEVEPNDELTKIKTIHTLPVTINGQLDKAGDIDAFAFRLEAGQTLTASLVGRRLGAPMDPMLHLFDESGNELAFSHDGFGLDPVLVFRARSTGTYIIRVSGFAHPPAAEVRLTGGKNCIYRLSLTTGPLARATQPAGIKRGEKKTLELWSPGSDGQRPTVEVDAIRVRASADHLFVPTADGEGRVRVDVGDGPELTEEAARSGGILSPPLAINGRITAANEEDRFEFTAKKGEKLIISLRAGTLGSPLDALLRLEDAAQKELLRLDDPVGDGDLRNEWAAPADGNFRLIVADMKRQGSTDAIYRLSVQRPVPAITATVVGHEFRVMPGKTVGIKLNVGRLHGHSAALVALAADLPPGVVSSSGTLPDKGAEVEIVLAAATTAAPVTVPIRLMVVGTDPDNPFAQAAAYDLAKEAGQQLIGSSEAIWLTVQPLPPSTQPATKPTTQPKAKP
jgi:hypothetical protein